MMNLKQWLWQVVRDMDTDLIKSIVAHKKYEQIIYNTKSTIKYNIYLDSFSTIFSFKKMNVA